MEHRTDRIVPLDELNDFKVAEGDPDVRGWDVISAEGRKVGEVENLLVDTAAMKVRYLEVEIDDDVLDTDEERRILIPIGYARLDQDDDQIFVDALSQQKLREIPEYRSEALTREYETQLHGYYDDTFSDRSSGEDFYAHGSYDADRFYGSRGQGESSRTRGEQRVTRSEEELAIGKREREAGAVEVDKSVETRHVSQQVPTKHEEVIVERRPATPGMSATPRIGEDEIRIPVTEEELVVEKRTVPKEEIVVRKQEHTDTERVEADLRREKVDIRREGDVDLRDDR
jgi:uncharacterized protein (TIGR02271 family)